MGPTQSCKNTDPPLLSEYRRSSAACVPWRFFSVFLTYCFILVFRPPNLSASNITTLAFFLRIPHACWDTSRVGLLLRVCSVQATATLATTALELFCQDAPRNALLSSVTYILQLYKASPTAYETRRYWKSFLLFHLSGAAQADSTPKLTSRDTNTVRGTRH